MTHDRAITPIEHPHGHTMPTAIAAPTAPVVESDSLTVVLSSRWRMLLVISALCGIASITAVWHFAAPAYRVGALLKVAAVVRPILSGDPSADISRNYNTYVATQRSIILSPSLIAEAIEAPEVRSLPMIVLSEDPVADILDELTIKRLPNTFHLSVSLTGKEPEELATIVNAIVKTYMRRHEQEQRNWDEKVLSSLRDEQISLGTKLKIKAEELRQLAKSAGLGPANDAASAEAESLAMYRQMLTEARKNFAIKSAELQTIKAIMAAAKDPSKAALPNLEAAIAVDPELLTLKTEVRTLELAAITDAALGKGASHPDVKARPQLLSDLNHRIEKRRQEVQQAFSTNKISELEAQIHEADLTRKLIQDELDKHKSDRTGIAQQEFVLQDLQHERDQLEQTLAQVRKRMRSVEIEQKRMSHVTIHTLARAPNKPNVDRRLKLAAVALAISFFIGTVCSLIRHRMDTRIHSTMHVSQQLGVRVLGSVHEVTQTNGDSASLDFSIREPIRGISTALLSASIKKPGHSRLITSPTPGTGKSSLAINLAKSLASTGRRVLLVDGDNQQQGVSKILAYVGSVGLKEFLEGTCNADQVINTPDSTGLHVLAAGEQVGPLFSDLLAEQQAQARLKALFGQYDEVIIDSPPVLANSHAVILATLVDEVVLVLRAGRTNREEAEAAKRCLASVGSNVVGAILNGVKDSPTAYGYGYGYGYGGADQYKYAPVES